MIRLRILSLVGCISMLAMACTPAAPAASPTSAPAKPAATPAAAQPAASPAAAQPAASPASAQPAASPAASKPAAGAAANAPLKKVRLGISGLLLPLYSIKIADLKGYYREEGLEVDIKNAPGTTAVTAVVADELDIVSSSASDIPLMASRGETMISIASIASGYSHTLSIRPDALEQRGVKPTDPLEKRLAALKGMSIAVSGQGTATDTTLQVMLKAGGLAPTDVNKQAIPDQPARIAAVRAKQIDGFVGGTHADVEAQLKGDTVIFIRANELPGYPELAINTIYGKKSWVDAHPEETRGVARAIRKANNFLLNDPGAVQLLRENDFKNVDEEVLKASIVELRKVIPADARGTQTGWNSLFELSRFAGTLKEPIEPKEGIYWTNKYLD